MSAWFTVYSPQSLQHVKPADVAAFLHGPKVDWYILAETFGIEDEAAVDRAVCGPAGRAGRRQARGVVRGPLPAGEGPAAGRVPVDRPRAGAGGAGGGPGRVPRGPVGSGGGRRPEGPGGGGRGGRRGVGAGPPGGHGAGHRRAGGRVPGRCRRRGHPRHRRRVVGRPPGRAQAARRPGRSGRTPVHPTGPAGSMSAAPPYPPSHPGPIGPPGASTCRPPTRPPGSVKVLRCEVCGRVEVCTPAELLAYARSGWPACCGEVMRLTADPGGPAGHGDRVTTPPARVTKRPPPPAVAWSTRPSPSWPPGFEDAAGVENYRAILNDHGRDGWELVSAVACPGRTVERTIIVLFFKRAAR